MKKIDLIKGSLKNQWAVNKEVYEKIVKEILLDENGCFGKMRLPSLYTPSKEINVSTRKEAEQKLIQEKGNLKKSAIERLRQMYKCRHCLWFDKCFDISLLEVIKNVTGSV